MLGSAASRLLAAVALVACDGPMVPQQDASREPHGAVVATKSDGISATSSTARQKTALMGLQERLGRASAAAVVVITSVSYRETSEIPYVVTDVRMDEVIHVRGNVPKSVTLPGGHTATRHVSAVHSPSVEVGHRYLALFGRSSLYGSTISEAYPVADDGTIVYASKRYRINGTHEVEVTQ